MRTRNRLRVKGKRNHTKKRNRRSSRKTNRKSSRKTNRRSSRKTNRRYSRKTNRRSSRKMNRSFSGGYSYIHDLINSNSGGSGAFVLPKTKALEQNEPRKENCRKCKGWTNPCKQVECQHCEFCFKDVQSTEPSLKPKVLPTPPAVPKPHLSKPKRSTLLSQPPPKPVTPSQVVLEVVEPSEVQSSPPKPATPSQVGAPEVESPPKPATPASVSSETIPVAQFASTLTTAPIDPFKQTETSSDTQMKEKIDKINQQTELIDQKINEIKSELCSSGETYQFCGGLNLPAEATVRGKEVLFG